MDKRKSSVKKNLHFKLIFARFYKVFTTLLVILIVAGAFFFILEPKYRESGQGNKVNLDLEKAELEKRQQHLKRLKVLVENYNKISPAEISRIKKILPDERDIPGLFAQFQELAAKNNLLLLSINFNEAPLAASTDGIKKISIAVDLLSTGSGSYQEIKRFVASLETNLRLLDIESVFYTPGSGSYSLIINTYYY